MGIYSNDTSVLGYDASLDNIDEAVGYDQDEVSCQIAMCESLENELSLFQATIRSDIHATSMVNEGYGEDEVSAFNEGVIGNIVEKIKEFFKKLWAKIKAIFHSFMAKFDSIFMKSNKEFVNKYAKDVYGKNYTDFSVKWSKPKPTSEWPAFKDIPNDINPGNIMYSNTNLDDLLDKFDSSDKFEEFAEKCVAGLGKVSESEFEKEFMEKCFEDEEEDDKVGSQIHSIGQNLINMTEYKKVAEKTYNSIEKSISRVISDLNKSQVSLSKAFPADKDGKTKSVSGAIQGFEREEDENGRVKKLNKVDSAGINEKSQVHGVVEDYQKKTRLASMAAGVLQKVINKTSSCTFKAIKKANAENRKVWAKAVAYRGKNEDAIMMEAFAELAEYEADCVYEA